MSCPLKPSGQPLGTPAHPGPHTPGVDEEGEKGHGDQELQVAPVGHGQGHTGQEKLAQAVDIASQGAHTSPRVDGHPLHIWKEGENRVVPLTGLPSRSTPLGWAKTPLSTQTLICPRAQWKTRRMRMHAMTGEVEDFRWRKEGGDRFGISKNCPRHSPTLSCCSPTYCPGERPFTLRSLSDHSVLAFLSMGRFGGQSS